tara:strand:- start:1367 stop:1606 length:240 start_codon:yes stop_codon:yes gene_type:complete
MPQIGWLEILSVVIIAILVLGPKEFPIALKKVGSLISKAKNYFTSVQKEISSVTENLETENIRDNINKNKKDLNNKKDE